MCNLGEGLVERTYASTQMETWLNDIVNIMNTFHVDEQKAIEALKIPEDKREYLLEQIEERLVTV